MNLNHTIYSLKYHMKLQIHNLRNSIIIYQTQSSRFHIYDWFICISHKSVRQLSCGDAYLPCPSPVLMYYVTEYRVSRVHKVCGNHFDWETLRVLVSRPFVLGLINQKFLWQALECFDVCFFEKSDKYFRLSKLVCKIHNGTFTFSRSLSYNSKNNIIKKLVIKCFPYKKTQKTTKLCKLIILFSCSALYFRNLLNTFFNIY